LTKLTAEQSLESASRELSANIELLNRIIYTQPNASQLPVAFATNSLYVLERNQAGNRESYLAVLLPVLR
jgi:hypothetical protein